MKNNPRKEKGIRRISESGKSSRQTEKLVLKTILWILNHSQLRFVDKCSILCVSPLLDLLKNMLSLIKSVKYNSSSGQKCVYCTAIHWLAKIPTVYYFCFPSTFVRGCCYLVVSKRSVTSSSSSACPMDLQDLCQSHRSAMPTAKCWASRWPKGKSWRWDFGSGLWFVSRKY